MQKEKRVIVITIGLITLVLVCVMFMQFKVVDKTDIAEIETMREDELQTALSDWKAKYRETTNKLTETKNKIIEYQETSANNQETSRLVDKELKEAKVLAGKTDVTGNGIQVTLTDNNEKAYTEKDLLSLVNELRAAGAEAISINGERVVNLTDIVYISQKYILVNSNKISSPYTIMAIGDQEHLKSALNIKNGYMDTKQKDGYSISVEEKNDIVIKAYSKNFDLRYIDL